MCSSFSGSIPRTADVAYTIGLRLLPLPYGYRDCGVRWGVYETGWVVGVCF